EVGVRETLGGGAFGAPVPYRAGRGPYGCPGTADPAPVSSLEATTGAAAGRFTLGGPPALVVLNPGPNTFSLLAGLGNGRLANPAVLPTTGPGVAIRAADFNGDGATDAALLDPQGLSIELSDGQGGFRLAQRIDVGFEPNGLTVADLNQDGKPDLLVSNPLGDVLVLINHGDGTFQAVQRVDQQVGLAVDGPTGGTPSAFI